MTPAKAAIIRNIFDQVAAVPAPLRAARLVELAGRDSEVVREVESLLNMKSQASPIDASIHVPDSIVARDTEGNVGDAATIDAGPMQLNSGANSDRMRLQSEIDLLNLALRPADGSPARFVVIAKLGQGGMGSVYRAEQRASDIGELRRPVALKVIPPGMDSREIIARFSAERRALAMMNHANIAAVFDAGLLADGRPFFAMEYVPGKPITRFANEQRLDIEQRLRLFQQVCDAVQHAHAKAVIHRDLKPANVLAYLDGNNPRVKVIDFGIAKAAGGVTGEHTLFTRPDAAIGTYAYMSPEQAAGDPDIDVRTDVYALGVILYELIAGANPFDFSKAAQDQVLRMIRESDPQRPDTRLSSLGENAITAAASQRGLKPTDLRSRLAGELGWIPLKALKKRRMERYETVSELRQDVERYLSGEPLTAGPDSGVYRVKKFVRRNYRALMGAAAVLFLLVGGTIGSATGWSRAASKAEAERQARADADRQRDEVQRQKLAADEQRSKAIEERDNATVVLKFLTDRFLSGATPERVPDLKVREEIRRAMIDPAAAAVGEEFKGRPQVEATARTAIGLTFAKIGRADLALPHCEQALELRRKALGTDHPDTLASLNNYTGLLRSLGRAKEAEPLSDDALTRCTRVLGADHAQTLAALTSRSTILMSLGRSKEAEPLAKLAAERATRLLGADHPDRLTALNNYGGVLMSLGRFADAEPLYRDAVERGRRVLGEDHPGTLMPLINYATILKSLNRSKEAEPLSKDSLERCGRVLGPDHPYTLMSLNNHAAVLKSLGRLQEAEPLYKDVLDRRKRVMGLDHPYTLTSLCNYANVLQSLGRTKEAEPLFKEELDRSTRVQGADHPGTLISLNNYVDILVSLGRAAEAEPLAKDALDRCTRVLGPDHSDTLTATHNYGNLQKSIGAIGSAEQLLKKALDGRIRVLGRDDPDTLSVFGDYLGVLESSGNAQEIKRDYADLLTRSKKQ